MARTGRLRKPVLVGEAHQALNDALHQLHAYARYPSLTSLVDALASNGVERASRSTIHNAFSSTRLPRVDLVDGLVVEMAGRVRHATEEKIDKACNLFDNLWFLADREDRERVRPQEMAQEEEQEEEAADAPTYPAIPVTRAELSPVLIGFTPPTPRDVERVTNRRLRDLLPKTSRRFSGIDTVTVLLAAGDASIALEACRIALSDLFRTGSS
ncbi:hypothetical protein OG249_37550 [Streptomyces microflavus]|uniref:hypothetical protein n=1 Tax=Streptomyces microflavus TaxID=1919 RepID=UPI00225AEAA4|nr:hypothetical protein [Streptomyces microflavus]MCX4657566.1 hypothetical protein [Streptomyces microflavus]